MDNILSNTETKSLMNLSWSTAYSRMYQEVELSVVGRERRCRLHWGSALILLSFVMN